MFENNNTISTTTTITTITTITIIIHQPTMFSRRESLTATVTGLA